MKSISLTAQKALVLLLGFFSLSSFAGEIPKVPFTCQAGVNNPEIVKKQIENGILVPDNFETSSYVYEIPNSKDNIIFSFLGFPAKSSNLQSIVNQMGSALAQVATSNSFAKKALFQYNRAARDLSVLVHAENYPQARCDRLIQIEVPRKNFFEGKRLAGINFRFTKVVTPEGFPASFRNTDLATANLTGSNFSNTDFTGASFFSSILSGTQFENSNFTGASLYGADLKQTRDFELYNTNFRNSQFKRSDLSLTRGRKADFSRAQFIDSYFYQSEFNDSFFTQARFYQTQEATYFVDGDFVTINNRLGFNTAFFQNCNFEHSQFYHIDLLKTVFTGSNLNGIELIRSKSFLNEFAAGFRGEMKRSSFRRTVFIHTSFKNLPMKDANFTNALLGPKTIFTGEGLTLEGARMNASLWLEFDARPLPLDLWKNYSAVRFHRVTFPDGFNPGSLGMREDLSVIEDFRAIVPEELLH